MEVLTRKPLLVCLLPTFSASSNVYKTENNKPVSPLSHIFGRFAISSKILFWYNLINTDEGCTHRMLRQTTDWLEGLQWKGNLFIASSLVLLWCLPCLYWYIIGAAWNPTASSLSQISGACPTHLLPLWHAGSPGEVKGQHRWLLPPLQMKYHPLGSHFSAAAKGQREAIWGWGEIMSWRWTSPSRRTGKGKVSTNTFIPHSSPKGLLQGMMFLHILSRASTWGWETG